MISSGYFVKLINELLTYPAGLVSVGFNPHYSTKITDLCTNSDAPRATNDKINGHCFWWHEEPINEVDSNAFIDWFNQRFPNTVYCPDKIRIIANSEKSQLKTNILDTLRCNDWYFFYHGFVALDWFRDFEYFNCTITEFDKVFITFNHILTKKRNYRLHLLAELNGRKLDQFGYIKANLLSKDLVKQQIFNSESLLSKSARTTIYKHLYSCIDDNKVKNNNNLLDASSSPLDNSTSPVLNCAPGNKKTDRSLKSMWHIVTETVYYEEKLHLTEKIFKPIVLERPFILLSTQGSLSYFKSYGFKTFDRWIDESYDVETDPDIRLKKAVDEIEKLCAMSESELLDMYNSMQEILKFNKEHFYGNFKTIIVNELIDNFELCVTQFNETAQYKCQIFLNSKDLKQVKELLLK